MWRGRERVREKVREDEDLSRDESEEGCGKRLAWERLHGCDCVGFRLRVRHTISKIQKAPISLVNSDFFLSRAQI